MSYQVVSHSEKEGEAKRYIDQAEAKMQERGSWLKSLVGSSSGGKYEEAAELFGKAANVLKLGKSWRRAGDALMRASEAYELVSDGKYDAASRSLDAAKAYKNAGNGEQGAAALERALRLFSELGRFQQCAKVSRELAELRENAGDRSAAVANYSQAADFYDGEDSRANANSCRVKIAELSALEGQYDVAEATYVQVAAAALESNLLKFGARDHLLRAGLCRLCMGDDVGASRSLERYADMDASFASSREHKFLEALVGTIESGDVDAFTSAVYEYDSVSKLDSWKTTVLLHIKNQLKAEEEDLT